MEENLHLFTTCNIVQKIWYYFLTKYHKPTKKITHHKNTYLHSVSIIQIQKIKKLIFTLTLITYEIGNQEIS